MSQQPPLKADLCTNVNPQALARWASVLQSYTCGWATAAARQGAGTFTVAPVLDGMWAEAQASGPAMRAGVTGVARADAVLAWGFGPRCPWLAPQSG